MTPATLAAIEIDLEASICRDSFAAFARAAWPVIEPTRALLPSVAFDAITAALQAVADGRIRRLAIATCPGTSKSLLGAVAFPAYLLLRSFGTARVMVGSYSWDFASRDSRRCRDLIESEWYQRVVAGAWYIREGADRRDDYWTSASGRRLIVSVSGKALGERCTTQIIDDALSGSDVHSPAAKREAERWVNEVLPSRLEDQDNDARVIIGQRLAVDDPLAGAIDRGWKYLYLPAQLAEGDTPCVLTDDVGAEVWRDKRAAGEPLVSLLGGPALARLRVDLGGAAYAAQYLQKPQDDSSAVVRRAWWRFYAPGHASALGPRPGGCDVATPAAALPEKFDRVVIAADLTFGSETGDYAVVQAWGKRGSGRYLLEQWRARAGFEASSQAIAAMAARYRGAKVLIEKAANGAAVIETLRSRVPGVIGVKPIGNKDQRLAAVSPTIESGCCYLPLGASWLTDFVEEMAGATKHDDVRDAASYAIHELNGGYVEAVPGGGGGFDVVDTVFS